MHVIKKVFISSQTERSSLLSPLVTSYTQPNSADPEKAKREQQITEVATCVICLENLEADETTVVGCGHSFHKLCIEQWQQRSLTCPLCRFGPDGKPVVPMEVVVDSDDEIELDQEVPDNIQQHCNFYRNISKRCFAAAALGTVCALAVLSLAVTGLLVMAACNPLILVGMLFAISLIVFIAGMVSRHKAQSILNSAF